MKVSMISILAGAIFARLCAAAALANPSTPGDERSVSTSVITDLAESTISPPKVDENDEQAFSVDVPFNETDALDGIRAGDVSLMNTPRSMYALTCRNYGIVDINHYPRHYRAECLTADSRRYVSSTINLPACLGNECGRLRGANNGNYDQSCDVRSCRSHGNSITCNCRDCGGRYVSTTYNLNNVLGNVDGVLYCFDNRAWYVSG